MKASGSDSSKGGHDQYRLTCPWSHLFLALDQPLSLSYHTINIYKDTSKVTDHHIDVTIISRYQQFDSNVEIYTLK